MFRKRVGSIVLATAATLAVFLGLMSWGVAQASPLAPAALTTVGNTVQQGTPMTGTMPADAPMQHNMPMTDTMSKDAPMDPNMPMPANGAQADAMPMQQGAGRGGMQGMMAKMGDMQGMMARMQRMMASDMMGGEMPMSADMQKNMGEMMAMMGDMQGMMGEMQGMMAGEMMAGGMPEMGQKQDQQMGGQQMGGGMMGGQGGMMGQMPMMGTMIVVMPMPMNGGMGMMGQMPMMQGGMDMGKMMGGMMGGQGGMDMGGMMGGQNSPKDGGPAAVVAPQAAANPAGAQQTGKLGAIEVKMTPPDLTNIQGKTFDFVVDLNATGADLGFDLSKQATLLVGEHKMPAEAWEVALDHGHHVNGVLKFPAHMQGAIESATVVLTDSAGGPEVKLTWPPAK